MYPNILTFRRVALLFCAFVALGPRSAAQTIITYAGGIGNDTTASIYARLSSPAFVAADPAGKVYTSDAYGGLRVIDPLTGKISATSNGGNGMFDAAGNWYYVSSWRVYKKDVLGNVTLVAGNGSNSYSGDGGLATLAGMQALDVAVDAVGNTYICDGSDGRLRKVNTAGIITTIAGGGPSLGDGGPATVASLGAVGVTLDAAGNIYIADDHNRRIRKVNSLGVITTIAGGGSSIVNSGPATAISLLGLSSVQVDASGNVYLVEKGYYRVRKVNTVGFMSILAGTGSSTFSGDGGPASAAALNNPVDIAIDGAGNVYIADKGNNRIRKVNAAGDISTIAGNGIPLYGCGGDVASPLLAQFSSPGEMTTDGIGNLYMSDPNCHLVRKIDVGGNVITVAGSGIVGYSGDGGAATAAAFTSPAGLAADRNGNLYIADAGTNHIRRVSAAGSISTVAGGGTGGLGDGGPATTAMITANGIAVDNSGNIFIADPGNDRIRKVDAVTGIITTVAGNGSATISGDGGPATAAGVKDPTAVAVDKMGNIFIAGNPIRKVDPSGIISSLPLNGTKLTVDTMGNIYVPGNSVIKRLDIYNYVSVIAGTGVVGYTGDNGPATAAQIQANSGIAIDTFGRLFFATSNGARMICCLGNYIDIPPAFVRGTMDTFSACVSAGAKPINTILSVADNNAGDPETWSVTLPPLHGTLSGFPYSMTATGGTVTPSGLTYTPTTGYTGSDRFRIRTSDGTDTATILVNVSVVSTNAGSVTGANKVCAGASIDLNASIGGGIWSMSGSKATVNDTGLVTGLTTGTDTVIYTLGTYCGLRTTTRTVTVNGITAPDIVEPLPLFCVNGGFVDFYDYGTPKGGNWSVSHGPLMVSGGVLIRSVATGPGVIVYSVSNECGVGNDSISVNVMDIPEPSTLTGPSEGCPGDVGTFTSTMPGGKWYSSNSAVATIDSTSGVMGIHAAGTARITYRTSNVCGTRADSRTVIVPNAPDVGNIEGSGTFCAEAMVQLSNIVANGVWSSADTLIALIDNAGIVRTKKAGTATISYTVSNGCGTGSAVADIIVEPVPVLTPITGRSVVIAGSTVTLRGRSPQGVWSSSDTAIANVDQWGELRGIASGTAIITYTETNSNYCSAMKTLLVHVVPEANVELSVYPIPAGHIVNVGYKMSTATEADVQFTDIMGRVIRKDNISMPLSSGIMQFDVSSFPAGVYTISVITANDNYIGRVVVNH